MDENDKMMDEATLAASGFGLASNLDDRGASPAFRTRSRWTEKIAFWIFRLATYFIIACTSYIFIDIGWKGSQTVFTTKPPFVNVAFLTEKPETLFVRFESEDSENYFQEFFELTEKEQRGKYEGRAVISDVRNVSAFPKSRVTFFADTLPLFTKSM